MPLRVAALALLVASLFADPAPAQPISFTDVTAAAGLGKIHVDPGIRMGSGGAFLDRDGDGDLDVLMTGGLGSPWLFDNVGGGQFQDVTAASGLVPGASGDFEMGVTCADVENDGDTDVFLAAWGRSRLFVNVHGEGVGPAGFVDATAASGISLDVFSTAAAFGDYDQDGFLDLYVGNYIEHLQFPFHVPERNVLLRNRGDGSFEDVTRRTGVEGSGTTLAVTFTDIDEDGDLDLFVGNDFGSWVASNELFVNDGPLGATGFWNFSERAAAAGTDQSIYSMGIAAGDIDHDLDLDYYVTNLGKNVLLRNDGAAFVDVTTAAGVEGARDQAQPNLFATSWSCGFHDFDRDTWPDLYVSNGHIPAASFLQNGKATPNLLYRNRGLGDGTFEDVSFAAGVAHPGKGRGAAFGDYDGDGDVDILQTNVDGPAGVLFRNDSPNAHHSLRVLPIGRRVPRTAVGTRVTAWFPGFGLVREANPNYGFESSSDPAVSIGTGTDGTIPLLHVRWLSGVEQHLFAVGAAGTLELLEPLLLLDGTLQGPPTASRGGTWSATFSLRNVDSRPHEAVLSARFHSGTQEWAGPTWRRPVAADSTVAESVVLPLPDPGPDAPRWVFVRVAVEDSAGGRDEALGVVTIAP